MSTSEVIDLYTLRCVTGALLCARHHPFELTATEVDSFDYAVNHLVRTRDDYSGEIAETTVALLSDEPDAAGSRTTAAIDYLAQLTDVDLDCASALAALLQLPAPRAAMRHPTLFDDRNTEGS